ncbi:MAG: hypothetical protein ABI569_14710 [Casimicrobiaceae bacterium]
MKSILDPSFRYVPSASTDVRKTFARVRREMKKTDPSEVQEACADVSRVLRFTRSKEVAGAH